ncbi:hypothetical protein LX32DRAFT_659052 [Colletotrichum zoysiae]|uniref:Uncharacterized protein n=1 Tax=Colletotrichum zoysiae TaxID=1216348 RepID=A0AAD9H2T1_9PEZI|nr:hypothetical protein LX32DRAFT_659052 [Colletotrichum zoysiae]
MALSNSPLSINTLLKVVREVLGSTLLYILEDKDYNIKSNKVNKEPKNLVKALVVSYYIKVKSYLGLFFIRIPFYTLYYILKDKVLKVKTRKAVEPKNLVKALIVVKFFLSTIRRGYYIALAKKLYSVR